MAERETADIEVKNRCFVQRLGFALSGIRYVWLTERRFRTQSVLGALAIVTLLLLRPPVVWWAMFTVATALVLALELMNSALEYACDRLHPGLCDAIEHAKDAAAGAVLIASFSALMIGLLMVATLER